MVRETRHLWVGNLPENIREDRIREHFKRYGRVQSVKLLPRGEECPVDGGGSLGEGSEGGSGAGSGSASGGTGSTSSGGASATVAFMDIKSAAKAHATEHTLDERALTTQYYEPQHLQHRFPTHGNSEDHGSSVVSSGVSSGNVSVSVVSERGVERGVETFESRVSHGGFYAAERSNRVVEHSVDPSAVDSGGYIPRGRPTPSVGYHVTSTRARDRLYQRASSYATGPPPPSHLERHRPSISLSSWLGYESGSSRYASGPPPPSPAPADNYQEDSAGVNSAVMTSTSTGALRQHKKQRRKSRSGSSSPSGSSRSGSSSSSRSGSSAGSSSGDSSSPSSSPHRTSNAAVSEDRRPLAICVRNLPARSSDTSLKDGLFHEYKKHGKVTWVKVVGAAGDRYAIVCFKKPEDVEKALEVSHDKLFFGCKIEVAPYQGYDIEDNDFRPYEAELDEYHPKATRTLFIGNLEKDVTASELRKHFESFGEIIEIDIKKQGAVSSYAFCQYSDISSVVKAMRSMDGEHLGSNRIKLGFGKSMPTTCVWIDGIGECISEKYLNVQFHQFGSISHVVVDRERGHALVFFEQINCAQTAVKEMRGTLLRGRRIQVDFASRECQETFYEHLERQGVIGEKPWDSRPSPAATFDVVRDRSFESAVTVPNTGSRFTRYETPPRARTASYSRTPGGGSTPGASPAHPTAMSRSSRRSYQTDPYYDGDYTDPAPRRFCSYDEFSQGSGASHDDYDSSVIGDAKLADDDLPPPPRRHTVQSVVTSVEPAAPAILLPPPDIRHLQKERVHLLEQLEECHSSGDENFAPKKRPKLENSGILCAEDEENEVASLLVTSHAGRKGLDVRRVSDSKILVHHGLRRGSCEGRPGPCKRRREMSRHHEHHDGSRPGTPLVDERPENIVPSEPRRFRERSQEGPLSLPLPRFAAQMMNNNNTSNSNNNNNTANSNSAANCTRNSAIPLAKVNSPPCASSLPSVPSPVPQPPASPPPRHPSPSPASSDSETALQSPSLEERIRSLDEKYEKWSGSRALSAAGGDALAKLDATASERFRFRHKLLDIDLKELKPSDIVKSVLAKRSVFDEDSKRLENFNEKYEAREYISVAGGSAMANVPTACGKVCLQYPFPSHPPAPSGASTSTTASVLGSICSVQTPVSPAMKTDPRTAGHNCLYPTPTTPITPGTSMKTASPELPPVTLPIGHATAASSFVFTSSSSLTSNSAPSTARMTNISSSMPSNTPVTTAITLVTTATPTIMTSSVARDHQTPPALNLSTCVTTTISTTEKIRQRKESGSRDSRHGRGKDGSRRARKDEDIRKDIVVKEEKIERVAAADVSGDVELAGKETKEARHERKERELREERERQERRDKEERDRKEREERERREKDEERREKERLDKERREREERERERKEREEFEAREKERREKERVEKERKEREEKERRDREERERKERELRQEKEKLEKERVRKEREEQEKREREEREKRERIERERKREREERERLERERRKEKEERERVEKEKREKEEKDKLEMRDKHEKEKRREREDQERREKEKNERDKRREREDKEKRDETRRQPAENHLSVQLQASSPAPVSVKRRCSSQDGPPEDESKRVKISEHRRDSKDRPRQNRRSEDRKHRGDGHRTSRDSRDSNRESKDELKDSHDTSRGDVAHELMRESSRELKECRENRDGSRDNTSSKEKQRKRRLERSEKERERSPRVSHELEKDFGRLEMSSKRSESSPPNNQGSHHVREPREHHHHPTISLNSDNDDGHSSNEMRVRHSNTDTDSDEPKKHSIFDIPDDGPVYISMYDKVKARSTKNMQKLEEEKRQVRLKDKFSQLKQCRARREEKKQSTSWDGDSVSSKALTEDEATSESDSTRTKSLSRKGSRSRIHSDTSEEEEFNNKVHKIKTERFVESDVDLGFADTEEKHHPAESLNMNSICPIKEEPRSSDDDEARLPVEFPPNHPVNNHQRDCRKKSHKKKQKRQKLLMGEEIGVAIKIEPADGEHKKNLLATSAEIRTNHLNESNITTAEEERMRADKKQRNKKDKRRERTSEEKVKTRRKRLSRQEARDSQRMEDIFGPLSDDVDEAPPAFFNRLENNIYASDSDGMRSPVQDERVRRKTEKKRRHHAEDENSVDLAEAGREIEAKLLGLPVSPKPVEANDHDVFRFTDDNDSVEPATPTAAEKIKEKKKKRKKSKEERSRKDYHHHHHHHHHHHEKVGALPYLGADSSPPRASSPLTRKSSPLRESLLSPIPKSAPSPIPPPLGKAEKKKDKFIPGFGIDIDETIHDSAVKSISEPEESGGRQSGAGSHEPEAPAPVTPPPQIEDKPRVVISQEETEDAVAALLEETFGASTEDFSYEGEEEEAEGDATSVPPSDAPQEDVEEMQQAVESLNASSAAENEADLKPDTPQSEHDLQIDTDTEEDPNYESFDLTQPPKTPDIPSFYKSPVKAVIISEKITQNCTAASPTVSQTSLASVIAHSWPADHKPALVKQEATAESETGRGFLGCEASPAPTLSPQYSQVLPCSVPIISEATRVSAASPRPPPVTTTTAALYQRLPVSPQLVPPLRQTPPRMPVVTTAVSVAVSPPSTSVPPLVQSRIPSLAPASPLSPNGQWSRGPAVVSQAGKAPTPPAPRIPVSVPITAHRPDASQHIYSTASSQQPVIQLAPGMRALAPGFPRGGGLPPLTLNIPPRPYMPVPPLVSGKRDPNALVGKSVIETIIPAHLEPPQRPDEPKLSPAVMPEPASKASTSPKVPSPNQPPTFIPETAKIDIKPSAASLSPHQKQFQINSDGVLSPKQKDMTNIHLLTTHTTRASTPSPVIVAHGQPHVIHKSVVHALVPPLVNQPLIKTVVPLTNQQFPVTAVEKAPQQPPVRPPAPGILVVKPHVPLVSTVPMIRPPAPSLELPPEHERLPVGPKVKIEADRVPTPPPSQFPAVAVDVKVENPAKIDEIEVKPHEITESKVKSEDEPTENTSTIVPPVISEPAVAKIEPQPPIEDVKPAPTPNLEDEETPEEPIREVNSDPLALDLGKDEHTDSKEDSDYWSAKEVNIESVIKTVDAMCEVNETHEDGEDSQHEQEANGESHDTSKSDDWPDNESTEGENKKEFTNNDEHDEGVETELRSRRVRPKNRRGGRGGGAGMVTRRVAKTPTGKRGGRPPRGSKQEPNKLPADVYEFHDDSEDDNAGRPRLILTIKSPGPNAAAGANPVQPVAAVKEVPAEEFVSPATNTRKSKRLAEKDGSRTTVDDIIEEVVRGAAANKALGTSGAVTRRSTRHNNVPRAPPQAVSAPQAERKSPRAGRKASRQSETNDDSGEEKPKEIVVPREPEELPEPIAEDSTKEEVKPTSLVPQKATSSLEPMTLIDPVTGMLIPMRESEEGQYIPVTTASGQVQNIPRSLIEARAASALLANMPENYSHPRIHPEAPADAPVELNAEDLSQAAKIQLPAPQASVITKPQPTPQIPAPSIIQPPTVPAVTTAVSLVLTPTVTTPMASAKPTSLKAHVLNPSKLASTPVAQQINVTKPPVPISAQTPAQNVIKQTQPGLRLQIPPARVVSPSLSPRAKQMPVAQANGKPGQPMSPVLNSSAVPPNPKQHLLHAAKQQPSAIVNLPQKIPISVHPITAPVQRIHNPPQPMVKGINGQHLPSPKTHLQTVVPTISVASPPNQPHIIPAAPAAPPSCSRAPPKQISAMEPPKVEVSMSGCIMVPTASPGRGIPVPTFEGTLHGPVGAAPSSANQYALVPPHRTQSPPLPPPAHHHATATQGDVVNHYGSLSRPGELPPPYMHPLQYQYLRAQQEALAPRIAYHVSDARSPHLPLDPKLEASGEEGHSPPLELRRATRTPQERTTDSPQVAQVYMLHGGQRLPPPPQYNAANPPRGGYYDPPPAHIRSQYPMAGSEAPTDRALTPDRHRKLVTTPPHASQVPPQADSLLMLLQRYPVMWQGLLALKNDQAAVQMHFVFGNPNVARDSLPCNSDGSTPPLRIAQRMRLEQTQVDGVARKMQTDNEHCMLLALPCGRDHMDVLQQSKNLQTGFITYLQQKQAAGIVNIAAPGSQQPAYVVHIFPSCDFANESLARIAPDLLNRVAEIAHLLIVIATV